MAPADYHDFFLGSVTLGGALVGLLFVAVSVNPRGVSERGDLAKRVQATSALAAFLSPVFISLVALLPASSIGATAIALGSTGAFFFAFGVTRTWEYVDGLTIGRWGTVSEAAQSLRRETDASPAAPAEPPDGPDHRHDGQ